MDRGRGDLSPPFPYLDKDATQRIGAPDTSRHSVSFGRDSLHVAYMWRRLHCSVLNNCDPPIALSEVPAETYFIVAHEVSLQLGRGSIVNTRLRTSPLMGC